MIPLPPQLLVEALWKSRAIADVSAETSAQLDALKTDFSWTGRRVAVAVGSRGIDRIDIVARAVIGWLKARGAIPFVIPAMGSHGGGTAEGQLEVLESFGVTESTVGAPIDASMETIELGRTTSGIKVFTSRVAYRADAVLIINRIKPHTDFTSQELGSGLRKMCIIGLGKLDGAFEFHQTVSSRGYEPVIKEVSEFVLARYDNLFGLALVEDSYHRLARIQSLRSDRIVPDEPRLFALATEWMPRLPFEEIDVLIIDEMGKNISGAGMDPNIIERGADREPWPGSRINVGAIYTRRLTPETHGNAIGISLADVVSARLVAEIDKSSTYTNALSAIAPEMVRIPMHFDSDAECLRAALRIAGAESLDAKIVRVRNTLALDRFIATSNYADKIAGRADLRVLQQPREWSFTSEDDFDTGFDW